MQGTVWDATSGTDRDQVLGSRGDVIEYICGTFNQMREIIKQMNNPCKLISVQEKILSTPAGSLLASVESTQTQKIGSDERFQTKDCNKSEPS